MPRYKDLTGIEHGDFIVVAEDPENIPGSDRRWICQCQTCGAQEMIHGSAIRKHTHKFCNTCISRQPEMLERFQGIADQINQLVADDSRTHYTAEMMRDAWLWHKGVIFD